MTPIHTPELCVWTGISICVCHCLKKKSGPWWEFVRGNRAIPPRAAFLSHAWLPVASCLLLVFLFEYGLVSAGQWLLMISFESMHPLEQPSSPLTFDVGMCTSVLLLKQYPSGTDAGPSDKSQIKMKQNCLIKSLQCSGMQGTNCTDFR